MLTDAELNQMLADAAEMQRLREAATPGPWESTDGGVLTEWERNGLHHSIARVYRYASECTQEEADANGDFIAASRSDKSAAHVERLVQEVRRLNDLLRRHAPQPSMHTEFCSATYFQLSAGMYGHQRIAKPIIEACHIHGVPVPEHLKPYEENVSG